MRRTLIILGLLVLLGGVVFLADRGGHKRITSSDTSFSYATTTLLIEGFPLILEIADNEEERRLGLGLRESLPLGTGMLFVFEEPELHGFWMKNMHFSIDIMWLNDDFCVVSVAEHIAPGTYPIVFMPDAPVRYVIEVPSGFLGSHNVSKTTCFEKPLF